MSLNLFGGSGGLGGSRSAQPKNVVEFRAGKMAMKGNLVTPDKRKGLVYIYTSEDNLTHFCWKDRKTGTVEDDLIVFPDDCEYKKVTQCKEESRVFLLKFKASARKLFFWMQEPKADGDTDFIWKVNDALNNPGGPSSGPRAGASGNVTPTASEQEMQNLIGSMSPNQLMQLIAGMGESSELSGASGLLAQLSQIAPSLSGGRSGGGSGGAATATKGASSGSSAPKPDTLLKEVKGGAKAGGASKAPASGSGSNPIQLQDLQNILSNIQPSTPPVQVDLASGVNSEFIRRITSNPKTVKKLAPLLPSFAAAETNGSTEAKSSSPEGSQKEVEDTLQSPQFQHALSGFCAAFPTGQLGALVNQFGMGSDAVAAAESGNMEAFLNAIQKEVDESGEDDGVTSSTNEGVEDMNVD